MYNQYEGKIIAHNYRFGIVISRFNEFISGKLLSGALDALQRHDVQKQNIEIAWVPEPWRFRWWLRKWRGEADTMRLFAWAR